MDTNLTSLAEAFLFSEGGSLTRKRLSSLMHIKEDALTATLGELASRLGGRGLSLIQTDTEVTLCVSPAASEAVRAAYQKELGKEIGDAGLEVLAIVLYRGPSTRAQIDYIRGVNTSSTIRNLLARGLVERAGNPEDGREYLYRPTTELLAHLGVTNASELPEKEAISREIATFESKPQEPETYADAQ